MRLLGLAILLLLGVCQGRDQKRGILEEAGQIWDSISDGLESFEEGAREELAPLAKSVEDAVGSVIDSVMPKHHERIDNEGRRKRPSFRQEDFFNPFGMLSEPLNPFSIFGVSRRNWWNGPNVCTDRKIIDENEEESETKEEGEDKRKGRFFLDMTMTTCRDDENVHECSTKVRNGRERKTVIVRHKCCYGFVREEDHPGCTKIEMRPLNETIEGLEAVEFMDLIESADIKLDNVTVFVPSDDAVEDFRHDLEEMNSIEVVPYKVTRRRRRSITVMDAPPLEEIIKGHMVDGFIDSADISDEDTLMTMSKSQLRMTVYNTYPEKIWMANCARVTSKNHYASNGVVHLVDKVILPATKPIGDIIESDSQFKIFSKVLRKSGLMEDLKKTEGQVTLFAPMDAAFKKLNSNLLDKIMNGNGCSQDILKNHILPNVVCTGIIEGKARTMNSLRKYVILDREDAGGDVTVEGKKIVIKDIMGVNGVIQVVDDVLIPESAKTILDALQEHNMTTLRELFEKAKMLLELGEMANVTLFAPTEEALKEVPKDLLEDTPKLKEFLMYHISTPKSCHCDFENNKLVQSELSDEKLRLNVYPSGGEFLFGGPRIVNTVQCARVVAVDEEFCGGMIHKINKILIKPSGGFVEIIKRDPNYSKFFSLIELSGIESELRPDEKVYTVLAPDNEAFEDLKDEVKEKLNDKEMASKIVKQHIIQDMTCCLGIPMANIFLDTSGKRMMSGEVVSLRRSPGGHIYANRAEVTTCDLVTKDGVIHGINQVLLPREFRSKKARSSSYRRIQILQDLFNPYKLF